MKDSNIFHDRAKEAGNKLKSYILSIATGATGVMFFTFTRKDIAHFSCFEKTMLVLAVVFFAVTVFIGLWELRIDSKRFYSIAEQLEKEKSEQDWSTNEKLKVSRLKLINLTYITSFLGFLFTSIYMVLRIIG